MANSEDESSIFFPGNRRRTSDATAKVTAEGLLGSRFITLEQGGSDTKLADGGVISNTQGAVDIWSLISQAMFASKGSGSGTGSTSAEPETQTP